MAPVLFTDLFVMAHTAVLRPEAAGAGHHGRDVEPGKRRGLAAAPLLRLHPFPHRHDAALNVFWRCADLPTAAPTAPHMFADDGNGSVARQRNRGRIDVSFVATAGAVNPQQLAITDEVSKRDGAGRHGIHFIR